MRARDTHSRASKYARVNERTCRRERRGGRMDQRDLWDVIVDNDDICFKHILPKLNRNDIKFLYDVNSETRALVRRSSRKDELKEKFEVRDMLSISTLEFVWEKRSLWPDWFDETKVCERVALTNKLELLKWVREMKNCDWDAEAISWAAHQGNLEMVKYCVATECPMDEGACSLASYKGRLECLKYLHEEAKAPWNWETAAFAAERGHLHILEYLVERKYDKFDTTACWFAAADGHLDCLKYLHETAKAPWDSYSVVKAHENNHPECLQYLLDNDCPLPDGWRYERGTLHSLP